MNVENGKCEVIISDRMDTGGYSMGFWALPKDRVPQIEARINSGLFTKSVVRMSVRRSKHDNNRSW
jgi:hypothetical protein